MPAAELKKWSEIFREKAKTLYPATDPSHDDLHISRVVKMALRLSEEEGADKHVVLPAAYLHDFINVPKDDPRRKEASRLSAEAAVGYLSGIGYPSQYFDAIRHAIAAHSFSANITPETLEAKVVQDADRLDGLGAIGIARCFSTSTLMRRPYYCLNDVWADARELDDKAFAIDHFPVKLFKVVETMQTKTSRLEARQRVEFMRLYLQQLKAEI
jgi:uncharacterized protein